MLIAVRTPPSAANDQYAHPLPASSEYTRPVSLPTKTRPATMDGCEYACAPPGNPNAHLSVSVGTSAAVRLGVGGKRVLVESLPHPLHRGMDEGSGSADGRVAQSPPAAPSMLPAPTGLPARNSATARLSPAPSGSACMAMLPVFNEARIASAVWAFSASRDGVRPVALPCHRAQSPPYTSPPATL